MGRVKRYKKYKACDPCAKKKSEIDLIHDESPEVFEDMGNSILNNNCILFSI